MQTSTRDEQATTGLLLGRLPSEVHSAAPRPSREPVASHLVHRAARRLEIVSIVVLVSFLVLWFLVGVTMSQGGAGSGSEWLAREFSSPTQWLPAIAGLFASGVVLVLSRSRRLRPTQLVALGLGYEVVVSYAIACGSHLGAFEGMAASDIRIERIGLTHVPPWILLFTVLVPAPPRRALAAIIASSASVPLVYLAQAQAGVAPSLGAQQFFPIFVFPYAAAVVLTYIAARIVHQLGVEIRQALELGSYQLDVLLGRGGMGEVWRASHRMLARPAAIKLIRRDALTHDATLAIAATARFEREAQVIASLRSPHTIQLYDFGTTEDGTLFYVMELLDGVDLDALVRRFGPLPAERVVYLLRQICASLAEAHRRGIVHRDIKPANVYLCRRGIEHDVVKVLDFGLVKQLKDTNSSWAKGLSRADVVAGTPQYIAPEMALGRTNVDGRADLYSLGCVTYWLLTGRLVFDAETPTAMIVAHVHETPRPPSISSEVAIPEALDRLVLDCLAKDPGDRPQSCEVFNSRLDAIPLPHTWTEGDAARWWSSHSPTPDAQS